MEPVLECHGLSRWHPGPIAAVQDVDLQVDSGELVAITGASGSGKSSLLAMLGMLDRPTYGTQRLFGVDIVNASERERARLRSKAIGFVFQSFHLLPDRTALENVAAGLLYSGTPHRRRLERAHDTLVQFGLVDRLHSKASTLSGGEQQRVAVARALVGEPQLLLCDEPTGNLDTTNTDQMLRILADLNAAHGLTIIIVTHDPHVAAVADVHYGMADGRIETLRTGRR